MASLLAIAAGGAIGALLRYWVSTATYVYLGRGFPYGTLAVNVLGSFIMGALFVVLVERSVAVPEWRAAILIGLLGAFTTFSTFSMETVGLVEEGRLGAAVLNLALSGVLCVAACWVGLILVRKL